MQKYLGKEIACNFPQLYPHHALLWNISVSTLLKVIHDISPQKKVLRKSMLQDLILYFDAKLFLSEKVLDYASLKIKKIASPFVVGCGMNLLPPFSAAGLLPTKSVFLLFFLGHK